MTTRALIRFVVAAGLVAVIVHAGVSVAAAFALDRLYPHRIFNVRTWSDEGTERFRLVGSFFVERARRGLPVTAFAGSSVTYGYPWAEPFVFSRLFADRHAERRVVNASIMALGMSGINDWIVCAARRNGIRFQAIVVEIPVVNTTAHLVRSLKSNQAVEPLDSCAKAPSDPGYLQLAALRPRGLGWLRFVQNSEAKESKDVSVQIIPVAEDYFASAADFDVVRASYVEMIKGTLANARRVADEVYAFPSPIFVGGLEEIGEDAHEIQRQLRTSVEACESQSGIHCLTMASLWTNRSYYYNLTHLNLAGHRAAADLIDEAMRTLNSDALR
jgi:hypothetical protein